MSYILRQVLLQTQYFKLNKTLDYILRFNFSLSKICFFLANKLSWFIFVVEHLIRVC